MVTKTIKGKKYELWNHYPSLNEAKKIAKNLDGRLHIITGKITETTITKSKTAPIVYDVWHRKKA